MLKFVQKKTPAPARMQMLNQTLPLTCEQMNCPVIVLLLISHQKSKWKPSLLKNSRLALQITVQDTDVDTEVVDKVCADDNSCQQLSGKIRECQGILYKLECQGIVREF